MCVCACPLFALEDVNIISLTFVLYIEVHKFVRLRGHKATQMNSSCPLHLCSCVYVACECCLS